MERHDAIRATLGPDPLRSNADPDLVWKRISRSHRPIGDLLMDQAVLAGVGNVYRAEILFRHRIHPLRPGKTLRRKQFQTLWDDLVELMEEGVRTGRIDTVAPEHTPEAMGRPARVDDHGGEVYVYRRNGHECLVCAGRIRTDVLLGRNVFWCSRCQPAFRSRAVDITLASSGCCPIRLVCLRTPSVSSLVRAFRHPGERVAAVGLRLRREAVFSDRPALIGLVLMTIVITIFGVLTIDVVPYTAILLPMFIGSLWLWPKSLPWFVIFCLACVVLLIWVQPTVNWRTVVRIATTFLIAFVILWSSFRRIRLGVSGPRGESMLVDLRERITKQSQIPELPAQWQVESRIKSAGGTQFSGDFVVASRAPDASAIELLVVDVSGKGVEAGTRALLLSGAFGGLTSAVPHDEFLECANEYLLRLNWDEGFATAIHVHLDLKSGDFAVRKAGHPPAVWMHAGSGPMVGAELGRTNPWGDQRCRFRDGAGTPAAGRCPAPVHRWTRGVHQTRSGQRYRSARRTRCLALPVRL